MDGAFLFNTLWKLLNNPNDLWFQVLINVWMKVNLLENMICKQNDFTLWKDLENVCDKFHKYIMWKLRDGKVNFWLDCWITTKLPLFFKLVQANTIVDTILTVKDIVNVE